MEINSAFILYQLPEKRALEGAGKLAICGQMFPPPPLGARSCIKYTYTMVRREDETLITKKASKRRLLADMAASFP